MNVNSDRQHKTVKNILLKRKSIGKKHHFKKKHRRQRRQIFISKSFKKFNTRLWTKDKTRTMFESFDRKKKKSIPLDIGTDADPTIFLNDYSTMSNAHFKDILLTALTTEIERNTFIELCHDNEDILTFTRQLTVFLSKLNYYKLQHEQWTYYYHFGMTEGIWHGRLSKKVAEINSVCYSYGRSKALIQQRQGKYQQHYEQIQNELETYEATLELLCR